MRSQRRLRLADQESAALHAVPIAAPRVASPPRWTSPVAEHLLRLQRTAGNAAVSRLLVELKQRQAVPVQRSARLDEAGQIGETYNMVDPLTTATDFGTTYLRLNGTEYPTASLAAAVNSPVLQVRPQQDGTAHVSVAREPSNVMSYRMALPSAPPWYKTVSKVLAGSALLGYPAAEESETSQSLVDRYRRGNGDTRVRATGAPSDEQFKTLVRVHENVHLGHVREIYEYFLAPWDHQIRSYLLGEPPFVAKSAGTAEQDFYQQIGWSPQELAVLIANHFDKSGDAFHGTPQGGKPDIDKIFETGLFTKTLEFRWKHPHS